MRIRSHLLLFVGIAACAAGCGRPDAKFATSERTNSLMREARRPVEDTLKESFGTPAQQVGWLRFPVEYGGINGTITGFGVDPTTQQVSTLQVAFETPPEKIESNATFEFLSGKYFDPANRATLRIDSFNPATNELSLKDIEFAEPPGMGDTFVIDGGGKLSKGRHLYAVHCQHCHGVAGDGNGPTAQYLNPLPRDYRLGLFKFTSTKQTDKAARDDLSRTIKYGIPGTYMPSFLLLTDDELSMIVDYVRWLAIRGEMEKRINDELEGDYSEKAVRDRVAGGEARDAILSDLTTYLAEEYPGTVDGIADTLAEGWTVPDAEGAVVIPQKPRGADDAESRERGRKLYFSDKAKCATCHGPLGKGNGPQTEDFQKIPGTNDNFPERGLYDNWGHKVPPRDLTAGIYRGGRRPIDLYRRIYAGIKGTPMPAFGGATLNDDEIWDIVNYVMALPYQTSQPGSHGHDHQVAQTPSGTRGD